MMFAAQHLEYWKEKARRDLHKALHILRWYDVKAFIPQSTSANAVEVILSTLVAGLNNRPKLPDVIIVMLGDVKFWCEPQALRFTMDTIIKSLLKELRQIIQARQKDLPVKANGKDPTLFFVKLNWKPEKALDSVSFYPKKRRTFNKLLDSIVRPRGCSTILLHEINGKLDQNLFLSHGELSERGYRQVWSSLSEAIHDFENLGHQKKKDYSLMNKNTPNISSQVDVDLSPVSSDDAFRLDSDQDVNDIQNFGNDCPQIQNKRRVNKTGKRRTNKTSRGWINHKLRGNTPLQTFFHH